MFGIEETGTVVESGGLVGWFWVDHNQGKRLAVPLDRHTPGGGRLGSDIRADIIERREEKRASRESERARAKWSRRPEEHDGWNMTLSRARKGPAGTGGGD